MLKDVAKAKILLRGLKQNLEIRGLTITESVAATGEFAVGFPKIIINNGTADVASVAIMNFDAGSVDIMGNAQYAYAPLRLVLSVDNVTVELLDLMKINAEVNQMGITISYAAAATLAGAEDATSRTEIVPVVQWPALSI